MGMSHILPHWSLQVPIGGSCAVKCASGFSPSGGTALGYNAQSPWFKSYVYRLSCPTQLPHCTPQPVSRFRVMHVRTFPPMPLLCECIAPPSCLPSKPTRSFPAPNTPTPCRTCVASGVWDNIPNCLPNCGVRISLLSEPLPLPPLSVFLALSACVSASSFTHPCDLDILPLVDSPASEDGHGSCACGFESKPALSKHQIRMLSLACL